MSEFVIRPKNKREEQVVAAFLSSLQIKYHTEEQEDSALLSAMKKDRKTRVLNDEEADDFIKSLKTRK